MDSSSSFRRERETKKERKMEKDRENEREREEKIFSDRRKNS